MGVEGFYYQFVNQHLSKKNRRVLSPPQGVVSNLAIDMNGFLHKTAQAIFGYGGKQPHEKAVSEARLKVIRDRLNYFVGSGMTEKDARERLDEELNKEYQTQLIADLEEVIAFFDPKENIVIAVDGIPPVAKINQQRTRRFRGASRPPLEFFNTDKIGVGTEWMFEIDALLRKWVHSQERIIDPDRSKKIIYSSHLEPGEGEHKIFDFIRKKIITPRMDGATVITGKDADLNMLSLIAPINKIYLYREQENDYISIDHLKQSIIQEGRFYRPQDEDTLLRDFILITNFIGNDFLPSLLLFHEVESALKHCFSTIYSQMGKVLTNRDGSINYPNFLRYLNQLAESKDHFYEKIIDSSYDYRYTLIEKNIHQDEDDVYFDIEAFRKDYYSRALLPRGGSSEGIEVAKELTPSFDDNINGMIISYFTGLQWMMRYYCIFEETSQDFYYRYHYAPLLEDLTSLPEELLPTPSDVVIRQRPKGLEQGGWWKKSIQLNPLQQMVLTLPPRSFGLMPSKVRSKVEYPGELCDMSPYECIEDKEGFNKKKEHRSIPILPQIDVDRISKYFTGAALPAKYRSKGDLIVMKHAMPKLNIEQSIISSKASRGRGRGRGGGTGRGRGARSSRGGV